MSLDERVFGFLYRALRRARAPREDPARLARAVPLEAARAQLDALAMALHGDRVELVASDDDGGWSGRTLFVPPRMDDAQSPDDNRDLWRYRIAYASALHAGNWFAPDEDPLARRVAALLVVPAVERALFEELPGCAELRARLSPQLLAARPTPASPRARALDAWTRHLLGDQGSPRFTDIEVHHPSELPPAVREVTEALRKISGDPGPVCPLWGGILPHRADADDEAVSAGADALPTGTERKGRARDQVRTVKWDEQARDENPVTHMFEKVETLEEYRGGRKQADGDDAMEEHADALAELDIQEVIRTHERAGSLLKVDGMFEGSAGELHDEAPPDGAAIAYDEWNAPERKYRSKWCSVYVGTGREGDPASAATRVRAVLSDHATQLAKLRAAALSIEQSRVWRGRQLDGPEVDLDAAVDRLACLHAKQSPPTRLYVSRRRHRRDLAALILLDGSLSTDGWVAGRRVIDVSKDAVLLLGEALDGTVDELGIAAFSSNTRRDCRFSVLKGFAEPWSVGQRRLVALQPRGYTRIGPALRHASAVLARTEARKRLLLLVSDGRPTDFDRYEGSYGVADVRRAAQEAHDQGVRLFALAVEREARAHLAQMFGVDRHKVLQGPESLAEAMSEVFLRVLR